GGRHGVVGEAARAQLTRSVPDQLLAQRPAKSLHETAVHLVADELWADRVAHVLEGRVARYLNGSGLAVDLDARDMDREHRRRIVHRHAAHGVDGPLASRRFG